MEKTQQMNFRLTEQTRKELAWVAIEVGMTDAEVLRALINKAFRDSTTRGLIKKYRDLERMKKAGLDTTSYNVRNDNGVKNAPGQTSAPSNESGTSSITEAQEHFSEFLADCQSMVRSEVNRKWLAIVGEQQLAEMWDLKITCEAKWVSED